MGMITGFDIAGILFRLNKLRKAPMNIFMSVLELSSEALGLFVFPCLPTHQAAHLREVLVSADSFSKGHRK